jgi:hypothetical protein
MIDQGGVLASKYKEGGAPNCRWNIVEPGGRHNPPCLTSAHTCLYSALSRYCYRAPGNRPLARQNELLVTAGDTTGLVHNFPAAHVTGDKLPGALCDSNFMFLLFGGE